MSETGEFKVTTTPGGLKTRPLFKLMVDRKASDLFFTSNAPIKIKIEGQIHSINKQVLSPDSVRAAAFGLMTPEQIEYFQRELEIDFAISEPGLAVSASPSSTSAATRPW
jgi:twitching motility protein PilU